MKHWTKHICITVLAMACLTAPVEARSVAGSSDWERNILLRAELCLIANGQMHGWARSTGVSADGDRIAEAFYKALRCDETLAELQSRAK